MIDCQILTFIVIYMFYTYPVIQSDIYMYMYIFLLRDDLILNFDTLIGKKFKYNSKIFL